MKTRQLNPVFFLFVFFLFNYGCSSEPVTMATSADGLEISFSMQGSGDACILLVHGWTNNNTIWDQQLPVLTEEYQVVAVDLAGHGKSANNRNNWTMSAFGEDIAAVVHAAKLKNVILVGFSMGGSAVLEAAKLLPEQVVGIILAEAINNPEDQVPPPVAQWIDSTFMDLIENPTVEKAMSLGFFVNDPEESMQKVKSMLDRDQTGWHEMLLENISWSNEDCIEALEEVKVPLIVINGDYRPTAVEVFEKYVPSFDAKFLSSTGHVMMWDVTDDFNRALKESIQDILSAQ